jgi:ornithine carbamoyltransferase
MSAMPHSPAAVRRSPPLSEEHSALLSSLKGLDLIELTDVGTQGLRLLLDVSRRLRKTKGLVARHALDGKVVALVFRKASTRTRVSFEAAAARLGASSLFLRESELQLSRGEPVEDTARVLSGYVDILVIRTYAHEEVEAWAQYATVPVVNALTDRAHPTQVVADLLTVEDEFGTLQGLPLAYVGDGNNMAHSYLIGGALMGMEVRIATPEGYEPLPSVVEQAQHLARQTGARLVLTHDPDEAVRGAQVVLTDVWASMGQEEEAQERRRVFAPYQVNARRFSLAASDAIFLHCLPAHRGEEVTAEVLEGPRSRVIPEAHNRLWVEMAILLTLLGGEAPGL